MEESLTLLKLIKRDFGLGEVDLRTLSPLTLAFVGDCVYDLILRTVIVERHNASPNQLHREKSRLAKAPAQAEMAEALQEHLTQEELAVYRRGRNAKSHTTAKMPPCWTTGRPPGWKPFTAGCICPDRRSVCFSCSACRWMSLAGGSEPGSQKLEF